MKEFEELLEFLYQTPIAVCRTDLNGEIEMLNPFMVSTLMSLNSGVPVSNILSVLTRYDKDIYKNLNLDNNNGASLLLDIEDETGVIPFRRIKITQKRLFDDRLIFLIENESASYELEKLKNDVDRMFRHDVRNQLNTIIGYSDLIDMDKENTPQYTSIVRQSASEILKMLNNSLDYFKMELKKYTIQRITFSMEDSIKVILTGLNSLSKSKQIDFSITKISKSTIPTTTDFNISADKPHIETALANLIKNAVEAAPKGSTVDIKFEKEQGISTVIIKNMGMIPLEAQKNFFKKYNTFGKSNGNGIGVYSAKLIIETHGGTISFRTSEIDGTELLVRIPDQL